MSAAPSARRAPGRPAGRADDDRRPAALPVLLLVVAAVAAAVIAAVAGAGGAAPLLLARVGARLALDLSWAAVLGILAVLLLAAPRAERRRGALLDAAAVAAGVAAVAAALTAFLLYVGQAPAVSSPSFGPGLVTFVAEIPVGRTWLIAAILAAVLSAALVAVRSAPGLVVLALLTAACLVPVALQSATPDGTLAGTRSTGAAAFVVLLSTSTWIGATAVLSAGRARGGSRALRAIAPVCTVLAVAALLLGGMPLLPFGLAVVGALVLALVAGSARARSASVVLLGVAAGLGVAGRVLQAAPTSAAARTSPAAILTGAPLPPAPTAARLLAAVQPDAIWLVVGAGLLAAHLVAVVRLRRSGRSWPALRTLSWTAGVLVLVWCTSGGPAVYAPVLLSAQLTQHAALTVAVPLLLAGGAPLRLLHALRSDRTEQRDLPRVLQHPVPVAVLAAIAFLALHGSPLLRWSVTDAIGAEWSLLQCVVTGALVVAAVLGGPRRAAVAATVLLLLIETAAAAVLGAGSGLLLADWYGAMGWGTDALVDQRIGAVLAWVVTAAPTLVLLVVALRRPADAQASTAVQPLPSRRSEVPA
ncbi:hypothetical protein GCM10025783_20320 [Amnibacterium soli]|uniref:Cytochrome c oxidase assembly protein n=2 Tax=Amnibacterium soli TaxID=1282736 RepID=A0ABP8Z6Q8_9MICO